MLNRKEFNYTFITSMDTIPSDMMLIAQAQAEGLVIITHDEAVTQYPVRVLRAKN